MTDIIAGALQQRLADLSPGERLPTVRELMVSFGASQFSVQQALGRLRKQGLIDSQVGRGTFVAGQKVSPSRARNVLVLSYEQQSDRADELTRLMHQAFLKRDWRSVILTYADFNQAAEIVEGLPRFDACVVQPRGTIVPLSLLAMLKARGHWVVVEGFGVTGIDVDAVAIDWPEAVSLALRHLYDLGHRRIGFVAQSLSLRSFVSTTAEFRRLHAWAGLSSDIDPVIPLANDREDMAFGALERYLVDSGSGGRTRFTAYIVYPRAFHGDRLIRSFVQAGLRIPQDVGVMALGYSDLAHEHVGRLDTVGQSAGAVVDAIITAIEARWQQPDASFGLKYLRPEIVMRGSTAALASAAAARG
jgi:DNA-binding LacI/PurR family transcriptional regulator